MTPEQTLQATILFTRRTIRYALPLNPMKIRLYIGCELAESDHLEDWRVHAHVFHYPATICLSNEFENLPDNFKLGILLHEFGHLYGGEEDAEADLWVENELGIDLDYVEMIQCVDPRKLT